MNRKTQDKSGAKTHPEEKGKRSFSLSDILVVAVILILVMILLVMGKRTCSVTLPADVSEGGTWMELVNDENVVKLTDEGFTSETEYTFKYKASSSRAKVTIVYVYRDEKTGDEMAERVAYTFTTDLFGFISVEKADIPESLDPSEEST